MNKCFNCKNNWTKIRTYFAYKKFACKCGLEYLFFNRSKDYYVIFNDFSMSSEGKIDPSSFSYNKKYNNPKKALIDLKKYIDNLCFE